MHINDLKVIWHWSLRRIYLNLVTKPGQWMLKLEKKKTTWLITTFTHALIQTYSITFYQQCWWILNKEKKSKININCDIRSSIQNKVFCFVSNICVFILQCVTFLFMFNYLYDIWILCIFFFVTLYFLW